MTDEQDMANSGHTSRRNFIAGTGAAAVSVPFIAQGAGSSGSSTRNRIDTAEREKLIAAAPKAPFDSIRDYIDARHAISVSERQRYILRVRSLAREVAQAYYAGREKLGFPLLKQGASKQAS